MVFGWDIHDKVYDNVTVSNAENGFKDVLAKIDISTLRRQPWNNNIPFFTFDFFADAQTPLAVCPRNLLKKVISQLETEGLMPFSAVEFEFYNYSGLLFLFPFSFFFFFFFSFSSPFPPPIETPYTLEDKNFTALSNLTPGMFGYSLLRPSMYKDFFNELYDMSRRYDIPLEAIHTETGPGVYEVAIEYAESLKSADRAALFKTTAKEIGMRHKIMPSFMAKPNASLPGCSGHVHYSLWDLEGKKNLFWDSSDPKQMSQLMKHFIAGQLHCLPYITPMLVPNVNSYKRLVEGAWAPVVLSWGVENRTSTIRVINPNEKGIRVETRLGGADINPYLAMAASLAAGLYGIKHKLALQPESAGDNISDKNVSGIIYRTCFHPTCLILSRCLGDISM